MTELLFNSTCVLVFERAPDPELDDEGDRVAGKGEAAAARECGDEGGSAHFFVAYDTTGLAHGVEVRKEPWIYVLRWMMINLAHALVGRRQSSALA